MQGFCRYGVIFLRSEMEVEYAPTAEFVFDYPDSNMGFTCSKSDHFHP